MIDSTGDSSSASTSGIASDSTSASTSGIASDSSSESEAGSESGHSVALHDFLEVHRY